MSIQPVSAVYPTLAGDTAGALSDGKWAWTSDDGRWTAFTSDAPNLVAGQVDARRDRSTGEPTWNADVFLFDRVTGAKTLVSRQAGTTTTAGNGMSVAMGISADGQYVLFRSDATNLIPDQVDNNADFDIFLYDRAGGGVQLVSHSSDAAQKTAGNRASTDAVLSADGSFVAFASAATNLLAGVTDANNASDVFLWRRSTGAIALASHAQGDPATTANGGSRSPSIAGDGQSVAFASDATNLVTGAADGNGGSDVFLFNATTGANTLVSQSASPASAANNVSSNPVISRDGQYVAYESLATNLVAGQNDANAATDVFLFSRADVANQLASAVGGATLTTGNAASSAPAISSDGRYVAFVSDAANLVAGQSDGNAGSDVFLFDRGDLVTVSSLRLVSHSAGLPATAAAGTSDHPSLSADGRFVAYSSDGSDLVAAQVEGNHGEDVFVYDRATGASRLASHSTAAATLTGDSPSQSPVIAPGGSVVVYLTGADDLVAGKRDSNLFPDLILSQYDAAAQAWNNALVSLRAPGSPPVTGNSDSSAIPNAGQSVVSADGRFVVFSSAASDLVNGQVQTAQYNVFLFDALSGQVQLISHASDSAATTGDDSSYAPTITPDGRYVAFTSRAGNLVENQVDTNGDEDVFVFDRRLNTMRLASHAAGSSTITGNGPSNSPAVSDDGRFVAFASYAGNLFAGTVDPAAGAQIFLSDLGDGSIRLVSRSSASAATGASGTSSDPMISADGRRVAFFSQAPDLVAGQASGIDSRDLFLFDATGGTVQMASRVSGSSAKAGNAPVARAALSADGQFIAFESEASDLIAANTDTNGYADVFLYRVSDGLLGLVSRSAASATTAARGRSVMPALSADGRYLAFASSADNLLSGQADANGTNDIFLYDRVSDSMQLVSHVVGTSATAGEGLCDTPTISADGRFVAYNSMASTLVAGMADDNYPADDVFRFDRLSGLNELVSRTPAATPASGDSRSLWPSISGDGRSVVFTSDASNLVSGDYNRVQDVYLSRTGATVNQAPSLDAGVAVSLGTIDQDIAPQANPGTTIDALVGTLGLYSDLDGLPPAGIAVTGLDSANGAWQFSTDGGAAWNALGPASDSSATVLAADGAGQVRIRFLPKARYNGSATLSFRAWDASDAYLSGSTGANASNNGGPAAFSAQTVTATITIQRLNDNAPPTASLNAPGVAVGAAVPYLFTVTYTDNFAVNVTTIDGSDVLVTGPGGFSQTATLDHVDVASDGTQRIATYRITPAGGAWSAANNGTYTVAMQANQVADTSGNAVVAGALGTILVDTIAPTATLTAPNVAAGGASAYTFTVTYRDNIAVNGPTLDNDDVLVTGPKGFSQAATLVSVDAPGNGTPRAAVYRIAPPGGTWDAADNGTYSVVVQANQVADGLGNPVAAGALGTFTVNAVRDKTAPKATLNAPSLTTPGNANYAFTVVYTDNAEVNVATLDGKDVRVTGPKGFSQLAVFDSVDVDANGTPRAATYHVTPSGGAWGPANNGVYKVTMQTRQVKDTTGNAVAAGKLGTFVVDTVAPTAALTAPNVTRNGGTSYTFAVTYTDNVGVGFATIDGSDIVVTGPNNFSQAATLVGVNMRRNGTPRKATYRITPPDGTWNAANNGVYSVALQANQVTDTAGNPVGSGVLGTFTVDTALPTATLSAENVTTAGANVYTFTVTFADNLAVTAATLGNSDLKVTGPKKFRQLVKLVSVDANSDGTPRTATYQITPPGGTWNTADNGTYTVTMQAKQVKDAGGNSVAAGKLGTFLVSIPKAARVAAAQGLFASLDDWLWN